MVHSYIRKPRAATNALNPRDVAKAYNYPMDKTGKGYVCGIIELGGGFKQADLIAYFNARNLPVPNVKAVSVDGGQNAPSGPQGADGEVMLDIEVAAAVAPDAEFRVYFARNSNQAFLDAIRQAVSDKVDVISISWGGPENRWSPSVMDQFDSVFSEARKAGIPVFCAAGDAGSGDGEPGTHVDFPASSPNVIGCGGTRLLVNSDGSRAAETVWNDSTRSATGGGKSTHFPGRDVPDVAGDADPVTGYHVRVDGMETVVGGTSAVAPLYAGLTLLLSEDLGESVGKKADLLKTITANPEVCFDVTSGNNGAFRAGPGRDETTGFGVVDGQKLLKVLQGGDVPAPPKPTPTPTPQPPAPQPEPVDLADLTLARGVIRWCRRPKWFASNERVREALIRWMIAKGLAEEK